MTQFLRYGLKQDFIRVFCFQLYTFLFFIFIFFAFRKNRKEQVYFSRKSDSFRRNEKETKIQKYSNCDEEL